MGIDPDVDKPVARQRMYYEHLFKKITFFSKTSDNKYVSPPSPEILHSVH